MASDNFDQLVVSGLDISETVDDYWPMSIGGGISRYMIRTESQVYEIEFNEENFYGHECVGMAVETAEGAQVMTTHSSYEKVGETIDTILEENEEESVKDFYEENGSERDLKITCIGGKAIISEYDLIDETFLIVPEDMLLESTDEGFIPSDSPYFDEV